MTEFNVNSKLPDLVVEGDVMLKEFNFLVDNKIDKPVKIGRVGTSYISTNVKLRELLTFT